MRARVVLIALSCLFLGSHAFLRPLIDEPHVLSVDQSIDEEPLVLTKWLHDPAKARLLSSVHGVGSHPSYSAFFSVNASTGSHMYFWFFPAQNGNQQAPLLTYLEGGPGASSLLSLFYQFGPFFVAPNGTSLIPNPYTWNKEYALLFIDNPVGSGFSFTRKVEGYATNEVQVATNLYSVMEQFFTVFPSYKTNEFYGGKYGPALAHEIHKRNMGNPRHHMKLTGMILGDPSMDPGIQMTGFGRLLFELGLADENEVEKISAIEKRYVEAIAKKDFVSAFYIFDEMMGGDFQPFGSLYSNITSLPDYFNYMTPTYPILPFPIYLNLPSTRRALHVGNVDFWVLNSTVEHYMIPDFMDSITPFLIPIMDNYKVLIYSGQLDVILGPAGTERYLSQLNWNGLHEYRSARKLHWYLNNDDKTNYVTGYVRQARHFTQVVLRRAGHMTILDAPAECLDMLNRFIKDESWSMPVSSSKRINRPKL